MARKFPFPLPPSFDTINIWDEKYDYVMHDDHWLTSKWSADCDMCRARGKKPESPVIEDNVGANNFVKAEPVVINNFGATITKNQPSFKLHSTAVNARCEDKLTDGTNSNTTVDALGNAISSINLTSSPISTTLKNDTTRHTNNMDISPPSIRPPPVTVAMTPIGHPGISTRAFVTPYTSSKFGGNETFNRTTRQSARKLLNQQQENQDLIDLNETFDLYRSCLAETPQLSQETSPQQDDRIQQHQPTQQNNYNNNHHQQQASSRIPKIPIRLHK